MMGTETLIHHSAKLGDVPYAPTDVVHFVQGLPGFERLHDFLVVTRDECAPIVFLASLDDP
jgi:flagellar assembly factor FliW